GGKICVPTAGRAPDLTTCLVLLQAGIDGDEQHTCAKSILLEMGEFFQIQDDYLDCYGDPGVTGKIGTDIEDNKCSWLVVQALQRVSTEQRHILEVNYGQSDPGKTARVKALYNELNLRGAYTQYEEQSYQRLRELITQHSITLPQDVFLQFAQKIYKREK
ncbi:farnesyl pyrophosphate synthase-like, partial [Chiloscyllium plagiosum]|uniref:farnesyl pyrophosphate synthase-like n=1 Tax=Chiloscyllium plagiosum TaxID=36176 RepID=UPI001CB86ADB